MTRGIAPGTVVSGRRDRIARVSLVVAAIALGWACSNDTIVRVVEEKQGYRVIGQTRNGKKHGPWRTFYPDGKLEDLDTYKNGAMHGPAFSWHENGKLQGDWSWVEGALHGRYRLFYDDGQISEIGWHVRYRKAGIVCQWAPDGRLEQIAEYHRDRVIRRAHDPEPPCPVTEGPGRRHLDPDNRDYD